MSYAVNSSSDQSGYSFRKERVLRAYQLLNFESCWISLEKSYMLYKNTNIKVSDFLILESCQRIVS